MAYNPEAQDEQPTEYDAINAETDKAWLVQLDEETELWLPKSQCHIVPDLPTNVNGSGTIYIPEWLAEEKGI